MRTLLLIAVCVACGWYAREGYNWNQLHQVAKVTVTVATPVAPKAKPSATAVKPALDPQVHIVTETYGDCRTCGGSYVTQGIGYYPPPL